jgi:hypothetical protein
VVREAVDFVFDLDRQLARRREHEDVTLRGVRLTGLEVAGQQPLQNRDDEGRRLARARLRARDEIAAGERQRNDR